MNNNTTAMMPTPSLPSAISYADPAAVAAAESVKARIQSAYIMAIQKPRDYDQARVKILDACKRPGFAEKVEYSKPVGKSAIVGPSVRFAETALREWGNIQSEIQIIYEDERVQRIQVSLTDLETNTTFSAPVIINKTVERKYANDRDVIATRTNTNGGKVYIVTATEDELANKRGASISKALRNEGLRLIPQEIIEEAIETARSTMRKRDAADPDAARKKIVDAFYSLGVQPKDLEAYLQHPIGQCSPAELQELRSMYSAIRDGEAKWADYFKKDETPSAQAEAAEKTQEIMSGAKKTTQPAPEAPANISDTVHLQGAILDLLSGDGGLGLTAAEQAEYIKHKTGKQIGDLNVAECNALVQTINADIDSRVGADVF